MYFSTPDVPDSGRIDTAIHIFHVSLSVAKEACGKATPAPAGDTQLFCQVGGVRAACSLTPVQLRLCYQMALLENWSQQLQPF